jgi:hypothetical protein
VISKDLDLRLSHDGRQWIAAYGGQTVTGRSLQALDANLKRALRSSSGLARGAEVRVFMAFDFSLFPTWMRQYHSHYFNRCISFRL